MQGEPKTEGRQGVRAQELVTPPAIIPDLCNGGQLEDGQKRVS